MESASVTVLVDNSVNELGLMAEHGWSVWLEARGRHVLFDTGQTALVAANAQALGVDLRSADAVVLSHGHLDHTGGLPSVLAAAPNALLYFHSAAREPKIALLANGRAVFAGMNAAAAQTVNEHEAQWRRTEGVTEIVSGVFATGEIPRCTKFEDTGGRFFLDPTCEHADELIDDQSLFFETKLGVVVILGCAHAGVINTLQYVQQVTGKPIHTVMGGMHLLGAKPSRISSTIDALRELGLKRIGTGHCTGYAATAALSSAFPNQCFACAVGTKIGFDL